MWNSEYKDNFEINHEIPSVFIDPVMDLDLAGDEEKEINAKQLTHLFQLSMNMTPYSCSVNCEAPAGFFSGHPWLMEPKLEKKRVGSSAVLTWQIWQKGCGSSAANDSYTLFFNNEEINNNMQRSIIVEETFLANGNIRQVLHIQNFGESDYVNTDQRCPNLYYSVFTRFIISIM